MKDDDISYKNNRMDAFRGRMTELTKDEAYSIAEFIDMNIFAAIRNDDDWDSFMALRSLVHGYEKCCTISGYVGLTDSDEQSTIDGDAR